jgi:hypothetical protein
MRQVGFIAAALFAIACGPDPNAQLPGMAELNPSGGANASGGVVGSGGAGGSGGASTVPQGTGGRKTGGAGGPGSGGVVSSGGVVGSGGVESTGGVVGSGGVIGRDAGLVSGGRDGGGRVDVPGTGGVGGGSGIDAGGGTSSAACANAKPITQSVVFNTTDAFCFVTCDQTTYGWDCDSFTDKDRTVTVNGTAVKCAGTLPATKEGGYYYFEVGAGGHTWDGIHLNGPKATTCTAPPGGFSP